MTVLGGQAVNWLGKIELLDNDTRPHVKVLADDGHELLGGLIGGTVGLNEHGQWLGDTNGVRELHESAAGELGVDERLGYPSSKVGSGSVDLAVVLSRESTTTVSTPATVGVDNDLTAGKTSVTLGTTNDEKSGRLDLRAFVSF